MGADNALFTKPKAEVWGMEFLPGRGWRLIDPHGRRQNAFYASADRAATALEGAQSRTDKARKRIDRPCLCCRSVFASEGIHNRLCDRCRRLGDALPEPYGISASPRGGRKPGR